MIETALSLDPIEWILSASILFILIEVKISPRRINTAEKEVSETVLLN